MKINILQAIGKHAGRANKDTNGGFGTVNDFGKGLVPILLKLFKSQTMNYPELLPAYVLSILKSKGHKVTYSTNEYDPTADLILIQSSIIEYEEELRWARKIKKQNPSIRIGFIGGMSSSNPELYVNISDFVIVGETEKALLSYEVEDIEGIVQVGLVTNLDEIPFPDWSHIENWRKKYGLILNGKSRLIPVQASRGCPMACSFYCTYPLVQGSKFRVRSIGNIIDELKYLKKEFGMTNVLFRDPIFTLDMERADLFCDHLISHEVGFTWVCETHPKFLTLPLIKKMSQAGCIAIKLGIESADPTVMSKSHRRGTDLDQQELIIRYCEENNINILAFFILGYFHDTPETINKTIEYAIQLNTYGAQFTIATPYPGTPWYSTLQDENNRYNLDQNLENYTQYQLVYQHPGLKKDELEKLKSLAYHRYYFRWDFIRKFIL